VRRLASALVTASLLAVVAASPISADTAQRSRDEFDRVLASFEFSDGGRDFAGQVFVQRDTETGAAIASFFYSSGIDVLCDNGTPDDPEDDFDSQDLVDFTANEVPPSALAIADNLSSASAAATASGQVLTLQACTDAQTLTPLTLPWSLTLAATGPADRSNSVSRFPNDDGTVTTQQEKTSQRSAVGTITFGGRTVALRGAISHTLIVETTR